MFLPWPVSGKAAIMSDESPKIIIDEDWKTQAQREKEELARKLAAEKEKPAPAAAAKLPGLEGEEGDYQHAPFTALVGSLATQCMFALGVIAPQGAKQVMVNLEEAAMTLEMLKTLEEKTQGNLTEDESAALKEALTELERIFTARLAQFQEQAIQQSGIDLDTLRNPEA